MSNYNQRGVFLQLLRPSIVSPKEVRVSMQFALKEEGYDPVNRDVSYSLLDSNIHEAVSNDGGATFTMKNVPDVDGDGDIDLQDKAVLIGLAKAYSKIINP
ncbi:hypothetical protein IMF27_00165 [Pseudomonas sp. PCH199]|uniref:hypothetical protein n=1 Tax=unclassified Pseudomonas TaxID=196821 RepID=UPI000BCB85C4|nr:MULTISPECIES: hypothetical protein [unclassified Pseudomonas]MCW8274292.1 hypothetical protein [Pseudomonas sp. PCH199]PAM84975.1 hypothetical protein CES87_00165 [Pseudomonas sp. ERMR1:02]